jgi:hypothetical protein
MFQCLGLDVNSNKEIYEDDLYKDDSKIIKAFLFIYSLETFFPYTLNKAERDIDASKVLSLGPVAWVFKKIF